MHSHAVNQQSARMANAEFSEPGGYIQDLITRYGCLSLPMSDFQEISLKIKDLLRTSSNVERAEIAAELARYPHLETDIALLIALDDLNVAYAVLKDHPALKEHLLYMILLIGDREKQTVIAEREDLTPKLTTCLMQKGRKQAVFACLKNKSAPITDPGYETVLNRFGNDPDFLDQLKGRFLSRKFLDRLCEIYPQKAWQLVGTCQTPHSLTHQIDLSCEEKKFEELISHCKTVESKNNIIRQLYDDKRLSAPLILRLMMAGEFCATAKSFKLLADEEELNRNSFLNMDCFEFLSLLEKSDISPHLHLAFQILFKARTRLASAVAEDKQPLAEELTLKLISAYNLKMITTFDAFLRRLD